MRVLLTMVLAVFVFQIAQAQSCAHCTIYNEENQKFTVYLNGEKKNDEPQSRIRIINLTQLYFKLRIEFEDQSIPPITKGLFQVQDANGSPVDAVFLLNKNKKGEWGIHWKSQTVWPGCIETNKPTVVVVGGGGAVQQTTTTTVESTEPVGTRMSFGVPGGSISINNGTGGTTTTQKTTTTSVSPGGTIVGASPCTGTILGEDDFASALKSINARSTEDGKLLSAKQIISSNCIATTHVKKIMHLFTTEDKKLEIAKYAYDHTLDKGNYFKLNDEFTSDASIDELNRAIVK